MKLSELKTGTKLQLVLYNEMGEKINPTFASELEWTENDESLYIAAPIHEGVLYPVHVGAVMDVLFVIRADDFIKIDMFSFKAKVIERNNDGNVAMLKIKPVTELERIQRRKFFRMKATLDIKYREPVNKDADPSMQHAYKKAVTRDLSGGGLCIATMEKLENGKIFEFVLDLAGRGEIEFIGRVVRVIKTYDGDEFKYKYQIGISFEKIEEKDREEIIRYIFFAQRKLRKKGLI